MKTAIKWWQLSIRGVLIGIADLVPGVSGGTMALLTGIYPQLLTSLAQLRPALFMLLRWRVAKAMATINFAFFIPLGLGAIIGILSLSQVIVWLLNNTRDWLMAYFLGMVCLTAINLAQRVGRYNWQNIALMILGAAISIALQKLPVLIDSPGLVLFFLAGACAICAMLLPGISGSLLLLLIGMYQPVIDNISTFHLLPLSFFALGALCGLLLFAQILFFVYHNYQPMTLSLLSGLTFGSVPALWPQQQTEMNLLIDQPLIYIGVLIALLISGLLSGWYISYVDKKSRPL